MMQLYGALILCVTLSAARGLRCYECTATYIKSCIDTTSCSILSARCFTATVGEINVVTKGCINSLACVGGMSCCEGDLCNSGIPPGIDAIPPGINAIPPGNNAIPPGNGAIPTGSSAILLLVSSAILKFLF